MHSSVNRVDRILDRDPCLVVVEAVKRLVRAAATQVKSRKREKLATMMDRRFGMVIACRFRR
jgi:hypothetical protein